MNSITELLQYSFKIDPNSGTLLYRGQAHYKWPIIPSIHRRFERYQAVIMEAFLLYILDIESIKKPHIYTNQPIEFLTMSQHYDIPTRLLDLTDKILTALYFACENIYDKNGNKIEEDGALFICKKEGFNKFKLNEFREKTNEPLLVEANLINPRINSQSGCFLLWGVLPINSETTETYTLEYYCENVLKENPIKKVIIPKEKKESFLAELNEKYGINRDSIYLNNDFAKKAEKDYRIFKKASSIITHEMTNWEHGKSLFKMNLNLGGCSYLQGLPENAGSYAMLMEEIINYDKHLVGRNDPCVCRSGKKYKKCCGK
jgi:hypothetical protein